MTLVEFFDGLEESNQLYDLLAGVIDNIGPAEIKVTKSQIAFHRKRAFCWAWIPERYLSGRRLAPLVVSVSFQERDPSPRWKQVVEPAPGRFMHHLELHSSDDIDDGVGDWLREAWRQAG